MSASPRPFSTRPFFQRQYQRFLDWLWFGPLTHDLRPRSQPTQLHSFLALLADLFRYVRAPLLPQHAKIDAAWMPPNESEQQR